MTEPRHYEDGDALIDGDSGDGTVDQGAGNLDIENNAPMGGYYVEVPDVIGHAPPRPANLPDVEKTQEG